MSAVLISGMVSLGIAGDYVYFGAMHETLSLSSVMVIAPVAGVLGGLAGGLFSRLVLDVTRRGGLWRPWARTSPVSWALGCGAVVAFVGLASGNSWRSEEHTSELQSLMRISYAVFCLKKKTSRQ